MLKNTWLIIRDYEHENRAEYARALVLSAKQARRKVLIAQTPALAQALRADGLHLPEYAVKRPIYGKHPRWILTASAHSWVAAKRAERAGVDVILLSPLCKTRSHPNQKPLGIHCASRWARKLKTPVIGLGGINNQTLKRAKQSALNGTAAIEFFEKQIPGCAKQKNNYERSG